MWIIKLFIYFFFFTRNVSSHDEIKELVLYALIYSFEALKLLDKNIF